MLTPQEVSQHGFARATIGGYNMAMVDDFLDQLTADYTALYKENASLKAKLKSLADNLEEYRATEKAMRHALMSAQQAAEAMVKEAEDKKAELLRTAEASARERIGELSRQVADEEARLAAAQKATADFVAQARELCAQQQARLDGVTLITAAVAADAPEDETIQAIEESMQHILSQDTPPAEEANPFTPEEAAAESLYEEVISRRTAERDLPFEEPTAPVEEESPTRRIDFSNLQFGSNFELED